MTKMEKECLLIVAKAAVEKGTWDDVYVELPVAASEERANICDFLERNGYAYIKDKYGRNKIVCNVQEKALLFLLKETEMNH